MAGSSITLGDGTMDFGLFFLMQLLLTALPGLDTGLALRSMRMFAEQVAPALTPAAHIA